LLADVVIDHGAIEKKVDDAVRAADAFHRLMPAAHCMQVG
jgi:hypothetical protein